MSRTNHVTQYGERPHRQSSPTRLTNLAGDYYWPYERRPLNNGPWKRGGGYARDRAEHALMKKIGKRIERRRLNRGTGWQP